MAKRKKLNILILLLFKLPGDILIGLINFSLSIVKNLVAMPNKPSKRIAKSFESNKYIVNAKYNLIFEKPIVPKIAKTKLEPKPGKEAYNPFKNIIFPIRQLTPKSTQTIYKLANTDNILDQSLLLVHELERYKKARRMEMHFKSPLIVEGERYCKFCYSHMVKGSPLPFTCPTCSPAFYSQKCFFCEKDISNNLTTGGIFCDFCLSLTDEISFKDSYMQFKTNLRNNIPHRIQINNLKCFKLDCNTDIDCKSNHWFCKEHWQTFHFEQTTAPPSPNLLYRERHKKREIEKKYPKWVYKNYIKPALIYAKNNNFYKGKEILQIVIKNANKVTPETLELVYELIADLCYWRKEYKEAIEYYNLTGNYSGNIPTKIINARRLYGDLLTGDEIYLINKSGYIKNPYTPTNFTVRNMPLVKQLATIQIVKWQNDNHCSILDLVKTQYDFYRYGEHIISDYFTQFDPDPDIYVNGSIKWYEQNFIQHAPLVDYLYDESNQWERFIKIIVDSLYQAENIAREKMGIPHRGEGWVSETEIYYKIKSIFINYNVIHQARPRWLAPQHLDIFIPKLKLAIEFQGDQHYRPVDFFGGEKTFQDTIHRDERKRQLCIKNNINLVYIKAENTDPEVESIIRDLVKRYLD